MKVRYFAGAAEAAGREEQVLDGERTLGSLRSTMAAEHGPEFAAVLERCAVLVDGARGADELLIPDTATVDVLPPFAGG